MARWLRRRVVFLHSQRSTAPGQHAPAAVVSPQVEYLGCGQLSCWHGAAHPNQCFFMVKIVTFITSATPQGSKRSRCLQQTQTSAPKMSPQCAAVRRSHLHHLQSPQPTTSFMLQPSSARLCLHHVLAAISIKGVVQGVGRRAGEGLGRAHGRTERPWNS